MRLAARNSFPEAPYIRRTGITNEAQHLPVSLSLTINRGGATLHLR
jgi:hypothetical protein